MPIEVDGTLKYVWGYPLLLSFVYRIVGFDRVNFDMFVYYKLVSVVAFALCSAVIYGFFRKRFSILVSVFFTLFIGTDGFILEELSSQYSDIVFMFFALSSVLLAETFLSVKNRKTMVGIAVLLGIFMWYTHEVRLNGMMIVATIAVMVALHAFMNRKNLNKQSFALLLMPFVTMFALTIVFENFVFWKATSNASDFSSVTVAGFLDTANYYYYTMRDWIASSLAFDLVAYPIPRIIKILAQIFLLVCVVGMVDIFRRKDLREIPYVGLLAFFFIGASLLPYQQEGRYVIPLMPFALLCLGRGAAASFDFIKNRLAKKHPLTQGKLLRWRRVGQGVLLCYTAVMLLFAFRAIRQEKFMWETRNDSPYLPASIEMYRYIQDNTDEEALFITCKPRSLYLNTQRKAIPFENGHTVEEADYFLQNIKSWLPDYVQNGTISQERLDAMTEVYRTDNFVLYKVHE